MPGQELNALKQAMQARQEAQKAASGGLPMPSTTPTSPTPLQGLQAAAPPMQLQGPEREAFAQQTGVKFNPYAQDIPLRPDQQELNRRADALINNYGQLK